MFSSGTTGPGRFSRYCQNCKSRKIKPATGWREQSTFCCLPRQNRYYAHGKEKGGAFEQVEGLMEAMRKGRRMPQKPAVGILSPVKKKERLSFVS